MFKNVLKYTVGPVVVAVVICSLLLTQTQLSSLFANASAPSEPQGQPQVMQPQQQSTIKRSSSFTAKGSIQAPNGESVLAPLGGQVSDFGWAVGDVVTADQIAMDIRPTQVYAANDGVVRAVRASVGDMAEEVQAQYGALCYIEREGVWHINASTSSAYNAVDNRDVRVGDTVRLKTGTGSDEEKGEGIVISTGDKKFTVELPRGDFELEDSVRVFLSSTKNYESKDQIGKGDIERPAPLAVTGEGMVAKLLVTEGARVLRGQPLFILDAASARYDANSVVSTDVAFGKDALIGSILVAPGEFVQQGQALMSLLPTNALQATLDVDELNISKVSVGQTIKVKVDSFDGERTGTVTEIRSMGQTVLDTTKFLVKVTLDRSSDLMIGMHVTGYWD